MSPWTCADVGSFAWRTCTQRWPTIVDGLRKDVPAFDKPLQDLRDEIIAGTVRPLDDDDDEAARWSAIHAFTAGPWTALPWYLAESFLYARIRAAVRFSETRADPFLPTKQREERALPPLSEHSDDDDAIDAALWRCLWGNRADLSLPSAAQHQGTEESDLVVDERPAARALVTGAAHVGILLDNAGVELACDLSLTRLLLRRRQRVTLFCKDVPFFVSDATIGDVERTRALLGMSEQAVVVDDAFLTGPGFLHSVYRLTSDELAVPSANVLLLQPVLGGGGAAHLLYNSVRIEAVLANAVPELPEIVRLGWLLSQLNLEVPSLSERVAAGRLPQTAELAMLPVALKAGEEVELCRFDRAGVARALAAWHVAVPANCDMVATLFDWWETYLETRPGWPVALAALDRMIHAPAADIQSESP